jgi:hypothetical protein
VDDTLRSVKLWLMFAGGVLVVAVLYWAQAVLVPFALAILLTFVPTPPVSWLQRWVGRVPAVLLVVTLVGSDVGAIDGEVVDLLRRSPTQLVVEETVPGEELRSALPEVRIAVGRWAPPALADESSQTLLDAGADHVASLLIESRNYFGGLLEMPHLPISDTADAAGLAAPPLSIGRGSA